MTPNRSAAYLDGLVRKLCQLPYETEWVEFKENNAQHQDIGEYISALANGAAFNDKPYAYIIWGIEDETHAIVGTTFRPSTRKVGNEPLENWLLRLLNPQTEFRFHDVLVDERRVIVLEIAAASQRPVAFRGREFIRVGSVKKPLGDHHERERALWHSFDRTNFETDIAAERVGDDEVLLRLEYPAYFSLLEIPLPDGRAAILDALLQDGVIARCEAGGWNISNLGAVLLAKNLSDFSGIRRKSVRVIEYSGTGRINASREQEHTQGYAVGFQGLIDYIMARIRSNEVIEQALRVTVPMFPEIAVRELVANALIHQDFRATGTGPIVEMFDDRIEITSPGSPLVDTHRFIDTPPRSRNETLGALMRRFRICEERGSGIDKVVEQVEAYQLPAPRFEAPDEFTKAILFAYKSLSDMDKDERVWACYMHACLCYVMNQPTNNASIRQRFGISKSNANQASRLLREALESGIVALRDPNAGYRNRVYLPSWAKLPNGGQFF